MSATASIGLFMAFLITLIRSIPVLTIAGDAHPNSVMVVGHGGFTVEYLMGKGFKERAQELQKEKPDFLMRQLDPILSKPLNPRVREYWVRDRSFIPFTSAEFKKIQQNPAIVTVTCSTTSGSYASYTYKPTTQDASTNPSKFDTTSRSSLKAAIRGLGINYHDNKISTTFE
jgi:hypothetical protein